ncbi:DUF4349 domain-containing protein [Solirubrobacter taibaiensis]|nr:DUF4349 domain-containing protein [Solirubrobacter taibaiensis]
MPDLETLLRDVKPAPNPAWALKLDTRVANRFPTPPSRARRAMISVGEHMLAIVASVAIAGVMGVIVIAGLSGAGGGDEEPASAGGSATSSEAIPEMSEQSSSGGSAGDSAAPAAAPESLQRDARAVKSNTSLTLSTTPDRVQGLTNRAITIVDSLGGFVQSSQIDQDGSRRAIATLSLRIPTAKRDDGLARISKLANVQSRSQETEDVTDQREALEAAVRDARADREGLRNRLAKATTDKERSRLRALVNRSSRRVTQAQRQVNELGREVSYATVDLEIRGTRRSGEAAAPGDRWTPGDALGDAVRVLEVIAGVLMIVLAILLPIAAIVVLAAIAARILTRRRRERALEVA